MAELRVIDDAPPTALDVLRLRRALRPEPRARAVDAVEPELELLAVEQGLTVDQLLEWGASSGDAVLVELVERRARV